MGTIIRAAGLATAAALAFFVVAAPTGAATTPNHGETRMCSEVHQELCVR